MRIVFLELFFPALVVHLWTTLRTSHNFGGKYTSPKDLSAVKVLKMLKLAFQCALFVLIKADTDTCPLTCTCLWDKNRDMENPRNELVCSNKALSEDTLPSLDDSIKNIVFYKVNLSMNHFDHIPVQMLESLTGVELVDLRSNSLDDLPDRPLVLPVLRRFYLSNNKLITVDEKKFEKASNLVTLLLDNNRLTELKHGAFDGLKVLDHLTLSSNQLNTIASGSFHDLGNLDYLSLHNNKLNHLESGTFEGLTSLHTLRLDINQLKTLPADIFVPLGSLSRLDMDRNKIENLNSGSMRNLTGLLTLYLFSNMLSTLPDNLFANMKKLQHLELSYNLFSAVPLAAFGSNRKYKAMQWLELGSNKGLTSFPTSFFEMFPNMEVLDLSGLRLKYLPDLSSLTKLEVLRIDDTDIPRVYPCDLVGLSSLSELYWDGAPIKCDCQSLWMKNWTDEYMKTRPTDARLNPKGTLPDWKWTCRKPQLLLGKDFRSLLEEQIRSECKPGEIQQWCHESKLSISAKFVNVTLVTEWRENGLQVRVVWGSILASNSDTIQGYEVTVQEKRTSKIVGITPVPVGTNSIVLPDMKSSVRYIVCVEMLGWGNSRISQTCTSVEPRKNFYSKVASAVVCVVLVIVAGTVGLVVFIMVRRRIGPCKTLGSNDNTPEVSFTNRLSGGGASEEEKSAAAPENQADVELPANSDA